MTGTGEATSIPISEIGERFASLRIADPPAERAVLRSLEKYGQMTPVVICRIAPGEHEMLDGFKRLRAARPLGHAELTARTLSLRACKAAMLQLNRVGRAISGMEEALVVHSLCHEDGLSQGEIAVLLGRHRSWVCRRLSLIERLSDEAQESIRLGLLPASLGAELALLQRCNQDRVLEAIRKHRLTWRETRKVIALLENSPRFETQAGLQGQMDWSPYTIQFLKTGKAAVECFSYILGFSHRHYIDFTPRRDFFTLIRRHQDAFSHFTGAPAQCLYDSEKTVVLRWEPSARIMRIRFPSCVICVGVSPNMPSRALTWNRR